MCDERAHELEDIFAIVSGTRKMFVKLNFSVEKNLAHNVG